MVIDAREAGRVGWGEARPQAPQPTVATGDHALARGLRRYFPLKATGIRPEGAMVDILSRNWGWVALRGILAILDPPPGLRLPAAVMGAHARARSIDVVSSPT
jgi:hypothetical protein